MIQLKSCQIFTVNQVFALSFELFLLQLEQLTFDSKYLLKKKKGAQVTWQSRAEDEAKLLQLKAL